LPVKPRHTNTTTGADLPSPSISESPAGPRGRFWVPENVDGSWSPQPEPPMQGGILSSPLVIWVTSGALTGSELLEAGLLQAAHFFDAEWMGRQPSIHEFLIHQDVACFERQCN
jgi:hypothetical protein